MAKGFEYAGLGKYLTDLARKCGDAKAVSGYMKVVLYEGAGVYADALREATRQHHLTGEMERSITLSQMKQSDGWYTKLGFAGYDSATGVANAKKAAAIESGTSTEPKRPFIRPALKKADPRAQAAMDAKMEELISNIMEV